MKNHMKVMKFHIKLMKQFKYRLYLIEMSKNLNYTCRGIYMWSYDLKYKPKLYNFHEENIVSVVRKVKDETEFQMHGTCKTTSDTDVAAIVQPAQCTPTVTYDTGKELILWMTQTEYPDVYNLYENENILISKKIGTALIPNIATSKNIRTAFKNKNAASLIKVKCAFHERFNKWYPIEIL